MRCGDVHRKQIIFLQAEAGFSFGKWEEASKEEKDGMQHNWS